MGCFSWMYADTDNTVPLQMGDIGYLMCPDGTGIKETSYDCYGNFGGIDAYDHVAAMNREFISRNPDFYCRPARGPVSSCKWYPIYSDLSIPLEKVAKELNERGIYNNIKLRSIGIDLACYDEDNRRLPYPIKITREDPAKISCTDPRGIYHQLPPSDSDPGQGMGW